MNLQVLLEQAGDARARLASPWRLDGPEHAASVAGEFLAAEQQVLWQADAADRLSELATGRSPEEGTDQHLYMAGLLLARSGFEGSATPILAACRDARSQVALMAQLNLTSLARTADNREALRAALGDSLREPHDDVRAVLAQAAAAQHDATLDDIVLRYLSIERDEEAARALTTWVCGRVDDAAELLGRVRTGDDPVGVAAVGLRAVVGTIDGVGALLDFASRCETRRSALRWLGRCPHPSAVKPLLDGSVDAGSETRLDIVNCLALIGSRESLTGVVSALSDVDPLVASAAVHHIGQLVGAAALDELDLHFDEGDTLDAPSTDRLAAEARRHIESLPEGRTFQSQPLGPRTNLDMLYIGYLPGIVWLHLTASYQPGVSFDPHQDLVGNLESIHQLERWLHSLPVDTSGQWIFHGEVC